jgi:hypothetical protein
MNGADVAAELRNRGVVLLRGVLPVEPLLRLRNAAARLFESARSGVSLPERFRFNPFSHSVLLAALADFGAAPEDLFAPLSLPGLPEMFQQAIGGEWVCRTEESWVRKKFAPDQVPGREYRLQDWHQDGALGVRFPAEPCVAIPMTELLTCWIPLQDCGVDSPGLEFVRIPQAVLLHYTELGDSLVRQRFAAGQFWAPELFLGDGLVFLNSTLHRTHATPRMLQNRMSVEYRIFPARACPGQ